MRAVAFLAHRYAAAFALVGRRPLDADDGAMFARHDAKSNAVRRGAWRLLGGVNIERRRGGASFAARSFELDCELVMLQTRVLSCKFSSAHLERVETVDNRRLVVAERVKLALSAGAVFKPKTSGYTRDRKLSRALWPIANDRFDDFLVKRLQIEAQRDGACVHVVYANVSRRRHGHKR